MKSFKIGFEKRAAEDTKKGGPLFQLATGYAPPVKENEVPDRVRLTDRPESPESSAS